MSRKLRILFCTEASYLNSGFATYNREVISRLHKTGKYEIAELANYATIDNPADKDVKWRYYVNAVTPGDPRYEFYQSRPTHQFGEWRFDRVCIDFKPDVVFSALDVWMCAYQNQSTFRPFFHWAIMPPVDAAPQPAEWLDMYNDAEGIFTYTDWALDYLKTELGGRIRTQCSAPPGVDTKFFCPPKNKREHKEKMGFDPNSIVVGCIMRNQKRKLFDDYFRAARWFYEKCEKENPELGKKVYFYLHTAYPDIEPWNIPALRLENNVGNKVLFSYICRDCNAVYPSFFSDARTVCPQCGALSATPANVGIGYSVEQYRNMIQCFDVYAQYAQNEGFGVPQIEAGACGCPIFATDYSGMADVVRKLEGFPIKVQRCYREITDNMLKALPDDADFVQKLFDFLSLPEAIRSRKSVNTVRCIEKHYTWKRTCKIYEDYFDQVQLTGLQGKWDSPIFQCNPQAQIPPNLSNNDLVAYCLSVILNEPELLNSYYHTTWVKNLNFTAIMSGTGKAMEDCSQDKFIDIMRRMATIKLNNENARLGLVELNKEDYIEYAHLKEQAHK